MGQQHAIEQVVITTSGYVTKGSGATALTSGFAQKVAENPDVLGLADIGVVVGIIGVIAGVIVNTVFQILRNRREKEIHRARMAALRDQCAYEA